MKKICTTKEQSQKLIELGLDVNTADMWYQHIGYSVIDGIESPLYLPTIVRDEPTDKDIPAWSLTALWELLPNEVEDNYVKLLKSEIQKKHFCVYGVKLKTIKQTYGDTPIDAVYEMIVWLLENKKI